MLAVILDSDFYTWKQLKNKQTNNWSKDKSGLDPILHGMNISSMNFAHPRLVQLRVELG